jgi:hypothetical protein
VSISDHMALLFDNGLAVGSVPLQLYHFLIDFQAANLGDPLDDRAIHLEPREHPTPMFGGCRVALPVAILIEVPVIIGGKCVTHPGGVTSRWVRGAADRSDCCPFGQLMP